MRFCLRRAAIRPTRAIRPITLIRLTGPVGSHSDRTTQFPADGEIKAAIDDPLVVACTWICAGRLGLTVTAAVGANVQAGPGGLLEQAKFTAPLNDPTEMMEIGGAAVGGKMAVVPAATVSTSESVDAETQKSPVAVPVMETV